MGKLLPTYAKSSLFMARRVNMNVGQDSESLDITQANVMMGIGHIKDSIVMVSLVHNDICFWSLFYFSLMSAIQFLWWRFGEFGIGSTNNPLIDMFLYSNPLFAWQYCYSWKKFCLGWRVKTYSHDILGQKCLGVRIRTEFKWVI